MKTSAEQRSPAALCILSPIPCLEHGSAGLLPPLHTYPVLTGRAQPASSSDRPALRWSPNISVQGSERSPGFPTEATPLAVPEPHCEVSSNSHGAEGPCRGCRRTRAQTPCPYGQPTPRYERHRGSALLLHVSAMAHLTQPHVHHHSPQGMPVPPRQLKVPTQKSWENFIFPPNTAIAFLSTLHQLRIKLGMTAPAPKQTAASHT